MTGHRILTRRSSASSDVAMIGAMLVIASTLPGCGSQGEDVTGDASGSALPDLTTPEAMVDHIASLTERDEPDFTAYYSLFHVETEAQDDWLRFAHEWALPRAECDQAARERFGEGIYHDRREAGMWTFKNVRMKEVAGQRATATFISMTGEEQDLQLVQVGDRWWISGYTWESYPSFDAEKLAGVADAAVGLGDKIRQVTARIRAGELDTAQEAKDAFNEVWHQHNLETLGP